MYNPELMEIVDKFEYHLSPNFSDTKSVPN